MDHKGTDEQRHTGQRIGLPGDIAALTRIQPLALKLEHIAAGQNAERISAEHVKVIRGFSAQLPCFVDEPTKLKAEQELAEVAVQYRPDELQRFADHLALVLNPDGSFSDEDRARRRGTTPGAQGPDGMSRLSGRVSRR